LKVIVEADGGARGNPGPAGYGAVVRSVQDGSVIAERSGSLGIATNNVAEYQGLIGGLEAAIEAGATSVEVRMDSKLVIEQMSGRWQIKHPGLRPLAAKAAELQSRFDQVTYQWVPRERNRHADALANRAMDTVSFDPRPQSTATRLLLVRHGSTAYTEERRYSGRGDVPLSASGRQQAAAVARRVAGFGPVAAISSPLSRCTETAAFIGVPVSVDEDLIECDFGAWEGMTFAGVREAYDAELNAWLAAPELAPPGGESFTSVARRVTAALTRIRSAYPGQTVAVVSHVSPIKLLLRDALAATDAFLHRLFLDTAGLSIVDYYPDGGVAVRTINEVAHLG
jgi:ribonuclease H / adenosylcobalamin/alpha-ribazole phosphatase